MPRKPKAETEVKTEQDDAAIVDTTSDAIAADAGESSDTIAAPATDDSVIEASAAAEEQQDEAVAAIADADTEEAVEEEQEAPEPENEALPTVISRKGEITPAIQLPEYLKGRRIELGRVVSNKMQKTVVVVVERSKPHPLYKKIMRRSARFMAHDEMGAGMGDTVRIIESRPMSKHKRWQVVEIVQKAEQI
jgi:small subunit ribosomal protein S17